MSFGFSITDFKEVIKLSWGLYEALNEGPQEIRDLAKDFTTVYGVLNHIEVDLEAKESSIRAHGETRLKMLQAMTQDLKRTIKEVQKLVDKFRPMAAESITPDQLWLRLKWTVGQKKITRIRQDISFHISSFTLLMTSMGNSSLQRIEAGLEGLRISSAAAFPENQQTPTQYVEDNGKSSEATKQLDLEEEYPARNDVAMTSNFVYQSASSQETATPPKIQQVTAVGIATLAESPSWLKPAVKLPCLDFEINIARLDPLLQFQLAELVFSHCRAACYGFYNAIGLHPTRYNDSSGQSEQFQLDRHPLSGPREFKLELYPTSPEDLDVSEWLLKMQHLYARIFKDRTINTVHIYDYDSAWGVFQRLTSILLLLDPFGNLNIENAEESLLLTIQLSRHLNAWDSFSKLKILWVELHRPSSIVETVGGLDLDLVRLRPAEPRIPSMLWYDGDPDGL